MDKREIRVSVRNLIEFILRSGDIDSGFTGSGRMVEGTKIHRKVQKSQGEDYSPEVPLKYSTEFYDFILTVEGRADGIIRSGSGIIIDEIKSTTTLLGMIDEDYNHLHWAQAKCYGYMAGVQEGVEHVSLRLTYYHLETEEIKYIEKSFSLEELREFFHDLLRQYEPWIKLKADWDMERDKSIRALEFPFKTYRKGQREMAVSVYRTIADGKRLFVQAPTGVGKTISTIFPAVKAVGEGHTSRIFYLTAKTIARSVAEEAYSKMREMGLKFKTITLTAKDKICFREKASCNPNMCEYARGHYSRVNEALMDILCSEEEYGREKIEYYARKYNVCPFEFSLDITLWCDSIICDYNYVFDPSAYLKRFFSENGGDYTFLIDEAHNLVDRSREMFSAELYKRPFLDLKRALKEKSPEAAKAAGDINSYFVKVRKFIEDGSYYISSEIPEGLYDVLKKFADFVEEFLPENRDIEEYDVLLELYFDVMQFIRIIGIYDERYVTYIEDCRNDVKIKLFCLDPSYLLSEALKRGRSAVFFSATLLPMDYYREILGGNSDDNVVYLKSPFDINNRCILIGSDISTRYSKREDSVHDIVEYIKKVIKSKTGNYIVFFPSYQYLNLVYDILIQEAIDGDIYIQTPSMSEEEREEFLNLFKPNPVRNTIVLGVLGGLYSEGIDLKDDRLIGVIIVSVGLPQICLERNIIRDYFNKKNGCGYEYSYMYPGMNKVMQAAGRVIRTEKDRGVILLIDDRFLSYGYQRLFPKEWFPNVRVTKDNVSMALDEFWSGE